MTETMDLDQVVASLTDKQRDALLSVPGEASRRIAGNGNVLRGLQRRGLCGSPVTYRDGTFAELTDRGCAAFLVLFLA